MSDSQEFNKRLKIIHSAAAIITYYEKNQVSLRNAMKILPDILKDLNADIYSQIHALVFETVRHQSILNRIIHQHLQRFLAEKISSTLRNELRVVTYLLTLSPDIKDDHLWKEAPLITLRLVNDSKLTSLLNNYFETLKNWHFDSFLDSLDDSEEKLAVQFSHPTWLVRDWIKFYGLEMTGKILESNNKIQPVYLRPNLLKYDKKEVIAQLREEEVEIEEDPHLFDLVKVISWNKPIPRLPSFTKGLYYIQDKGSALISHILDPQHGERILDACAAPGGKTTHIAFLQNDSGSIVAVDNHFRRLTELVSKIRLFKIESVFPLLYDLRVGVPFTVEFDKILVDAPCSGSGTFSSRPDAKWRIDRHQTKWLSNLQYTLLSNTSLMLKNSSTAALVYATCSLHPIENEFVIRQFLANHPNFTLKTQKIFIGTPSPEFPQAQRLFPHLNETEGFTIFKLGIKSS
ncbi:MAG: RsmB/NOP family class I SAM-dependent RNA methyltransferase [Candidatus Heimdallarchaeota archaeon]|nr:MAG: RsmB/NOP family class I SAM-dependent RNA methyltransferase [Candidatus Heimdallarchaeota archaeon]